MKQLIRSTTAYKIFAGEADENKLSHAYMLYFADSYNLRGALKIFACKAFGFKEGERGARLVESESFIDLKIYPKKDRKLSVDDAGEILGDSALLPVEGVKKIYIISSFETASALFQNKLLKVLEEPPQGVYFLLGACSLAPVLDTVKSRVKTLEIPPFTAEAIYSALQRKGENSLNGAAAESCGGILGEAENMIYGGWYEKVFTAAGEICRAKTYADAGVLSAKYGDTVYKNELLREMQRQYMQMLKDGLKGGETPVSVQALVYAMESVNGAFADVKFNANFSALLYDFITRVVSENVKWLKL